MPSVAFDTLKLAQRLEKAGFPIKQAQDMAAAQAEAVAEWQVNLDLATKADLQKMEDRVDARFAEVNQRIAEKSVETIKWVVGMAIAQAGLIIGILRMHS